MIGKFETHNTETDSKDNDQIKEQNSQLESVFDDDEIDYPDKNTADYSDDDLKALYEDFKISDEEIEYLDNNTIDTDFLPQVKDSEGNYIDPKIAQFRSPFANQENNKRDKAKEEAGTYGKEVLMPDSWKTAAIERGSILYQLSKKEGTPSPYFTDEKTVDSCRDSETGKVDLSALKAKLQINDSDDLKNTLSSYIVNDEIKAAEGSAVENTQYGDGGGKQYFVLDADQLKNNGSKKSGENS